MSYIIQSRTEGERRDIGFLGVLIVISERKTLLRNVERLNVIDANKDDKKGNE